METRPNNCPFCSAPVVGDGPVCQQCGFDLASDWQPASAEEAQSVFDPRHRACTACGELNPLTADFCGKCNAPVGNCASWKPFERIFAEGFIYRRTIEGLAGLPPAASVGRVLLGLSLLTSGLISGIGAIVLVWAGLDHLRRANMTEILGVSLMLLTGLLFGYLGLRILFPQAHCQPKADDGDGNAH